MNQDQEIRAKALEIAVLIRGGDVPGKLSGKGELVIGHYQWLADAIEQHIRGTLKPSPAESVENP
ncbi:MAG: hypothetical protein LBB72_01445 [Spirochaetaceae bacterium]|jgi:hypothetical protein|nr:hypothetical protein [Spirochaetaceae bacterium]